MEQDKKLSPTDKMDMPSPVSNLIDYVDIILNNRKFIGYIVGATFIISAIISLLLPKAYIATARILPPQGNNMGLAALLSNTDDPVSGLANSLLDSKTPSTLYLGIMRSRTVADALIQKFQLKDLYDHRYIEDVYLELEERSTIAISKKDQLISVSVEDGDPQRAADMANAYIDMLNRINRDLNITHGKRKRIFLQDRLKEVRKDLRKAEIELQTFQEKHHLISLEEQAKVSIEGAAKIKGKIISAQTELEVFKQFGTEKQIEALMLKTKIEELQNQLSMIENGRKSKAHDAKGSDFYFPFGDLPRLGLQLMRLTREAKIQEKLFELLVAQYEMAKIEEAKDVDTIQVLDKAVAPQKRYRPKRIRIILVSTMMALAVALLAVFGRRYCHRITL
jgi:uncharacterized protein involved in exopolysaccharide biosynthesis